MMISERMYNRICQIFFNEEIRLHNDYISKLNYIIRYQPTDPEPYIKLIQARTRKDYFDKYIFSLLNWFDKFIK